MKLNRILAGLCVALCLSGVAFGATLLPNAKQTFVNANGAPLAGGTVFFYIPNTSTPKDTWRDPAQTTLNANPVVLDAAGSATIYGSGSYRQVLKDSAGNIIWDQITSDVGAGLGSWAGTSTGSSNAQAVKAANFTRGDGQTISFVAGFTNAGAMTVNPNGTGPINVLNDTPTGAVSLSGGEVVAGNVITLVYSATAGAFHTSLTTSSIPAGTIMEFAGAVPPTGFIFANGQCLSRTVNARLFSVIGLTYGDCGGTTFFAVPDRRGRVAAGKEDMGGADAGRLAGAGMGAARLVLGGAGGEANHTLSIAELPVVTPTGTVSVTFPSYTYAGARVQPGTTFGGAGASYQITNDVPGLTATSTVGPTAFTLSLSPFGSGAAHNVVQPTIIMNFIIKF